MRGLILLAAIAALYLGFRWFVRQPRKTRLQAAAVTVLYVLLVEVVILREVPLRRLPGIMRNSMVLVGGILVILGVSLASTNYMIDAQIPSRLFRAINEQISSPLGFLMLLNLFLLALGTMLDIFSALVLMVPLLLLYALSILLSFLAASRILFGPVKGHLKSKVKVTRK